MLDAWRSLLGASPADERRVGTARPLAARPLATGEHEAQPVAPSEGAAREARARGEGAEEGPPGGDAKRQRSWGERSMLHSLPRGDEDAPAER